MRDQELESLGIEPRRKNDLNDAKELDELINNIKQMLFQDYKTAYESNLDKSHFGHLI